MILTRNIRVIKNNYKKFFSLVFLLALSISSFAQDDCSSAVNLGTLPAPAACGTTNSGTTLTYNGTTTGATSENPYSSLACMDSPAADVWVSFVAQGNEMDIDFTSSLGGANIGLYASTAGCGTLTGIDCQNSNNGNISTTITAVVPGNTYYIQISGEDDTDFSDFQLDLTAINNCDLCVLGSNLTVNPTPVGGFYLPGTVVDVCVEITEFDQIGANWLAGIIPSFGVGWDTATLTGTTAPAGTAVVGGEYIWVWANGPSGWGWYVDVDPTGGGPGGTPDGDYTNNFGDPGIDGVGSWTFCFQIATTSACVANLDLGIDIDTQSDFETGGYGTAGCVGDPSFPFVAEMQCCDIPLITSVDATCAVLGSGTVEGQDGVSPYDYVWEDSTGTTIYTDNNNAGVSSLGGLAADTYTITVTDDNGCVQIIDITIAGTPVLDAGTNGTLVACDSDGTTDLFGQLGGTPDAGGVWSPAMASGTGVFDPAVDAATTYTYTVGAIPCLITADVVVTVNPAVDAGIDGALTSCATGGTTDLFGQLGGTPQVGGVWSPAMASGTGVFDPTVDAGVTYTYTVTGTAPCADATADVVVTITAAPDAGTSGTLVACDSDGTTDLFGQLGGTPDAGGVWSPAMASGTGVFDPAVDAATTYTYTINIAGCTIVSADVVVTVNPAVDAGIDGALTSCATGGTTDLFGQLGGTPQVGGVWSPAMASGTGVFDPTVDAGVTYTYTVTGTAPCADATADVVVTITAAPDAGTSGTLVACDSDGTTDLFGQLGGTPDAGGVWSPAMASGTGVFDPAVDAATTYTYTINIAGCTIVSADVVVTVNPAVDAGLDGALTSCATGGTTDLFGQLGGTPQAGGVWSPAMASGTGVFDPTVDAGVTYTYTVTGTAPCADATADVVVTITAAPDAGTNGTLVACDSDGTTDLFGQLGGTPDAGGVWSPAMASGTGVFDPAVDAATTYTYTINIAGCTIVSADVVVTVNPAVDAGLDGALTSCATGGTTDLFGQLGGTPQAGGVWSPAMASGTGVFDPTVDAGVTYTYTVTGTAPCADATADVVVTITAAPDAGTNGTLVACDSDGTTDLFGQLGGTPDAGGVWSPAMASGTGVFDPAVDAATTYTYTINIAGCTIVSADVVVTVNPAVDAGLDGALTSCATGGTTDLFGQLGGTPQVGGVWSPAMASGTGVFDPTVDAGVTYTYTVTGTAPCADATADVVVTITAAPDAGTNGTLVACDSDGTTDLFGQLGGTPDAGGVWSPAMASGTGVFDPAVDAATTYTYTINIAGCTIVSADVVVTVNPAVDAGIDGALTSCATGGTTDLFGQLGGTPQVGGVWSPAMASGTGVFDPTVDAGVTYTYTVTGTAPCADATADVVVTITAAPDAGTNGTLVACDSDGTTDLFGQLGGTPDAGGVWSPAMASGTGVFDPAVDAATTYTYTINIAGCTIVSADVVVTVNPAVDAGLDGALTSCATGGTTDLFGQLGGTPQVGGVWSPAMASGTGVFDPTVDAGVTYTYTVTGTAPCADATADVVVTITAAPDAGTNGTLVACDSDGTTDLFGQLGGTPDAGGVWSPAMASGTGVFDPAVDAATTYTYTINIAGCTIVSADVVVTVNPAVDAGLDGALTSCATGGTTDLFGQLGGTPQAGGVWSPAMASGTGVFDPTVDAGVTYTYTVTGTAPCADATADVVVTITAAPDAGTNGTLVACDSDGTTDLFGQLGGTPDAGGVWSPAMASGTGVFDPAVDAATTYTYTINIAGCTIVSADVVVTVNPAVDAGIDGALTSCATGGTTDLFGQLGGTPQAGGVWSPAMASGTGVFDPTVDAGVTYTYTVTGTAPCADATADVVVTITAAPDAGTNGTLVACDSDGTTDLFGQLGGTPDAGGVWSPAMASGTGVFDPAVDAATTYTYTINIAGCTIVSADVVVTVNPAVDAGLDGALSICATGGTTDLFGQLGGTPQAGGVWSPAMASGTGVFDPTVDAGVTYTYTVTGTAPCADATADVVVTITAAPDAGTNGTLVACDSDGTTDLFGQLGGTPDAGGVWSPAMASGTGVFDPAVDAATTYTYTINIAGCTMVSADVVVTVNPAVDAGLDGALTSCATGGTTDLFGQLGGTPQVGGVWSPAMASGTGVFDPTVDAGVTYTYTVTGTAPCADATADVVVTITAAPDAGTNGTLVACDSDGTTDLFGQLGGTPDAGGVWSPAMASGTGVFDPAVDAATTYTYTINIAGCVISSADVVVTVNPAVDAGVDGALSICATGGTTDLFGQLGGTPQVGGVWSPAMASGTGVFDPTVDAGVTYTYTVTGTAPCADATADVVVTITAAPDAGTNGTLVACDSDGTTDLFGQLGGTPDAGGVWSPAMASGTGVFDPAVDAATTYTYTINIAGCTIVSADVVVTVNPAVDAGLDGALTSCATGGTTDLFGQLGGTPQVGGVWSPAMASGTGVFDPTVDAGVTYTYTVTGTAPCADATADVVVTITAAPDAGTNGTLVACDSDGTTDLFGQLGGTPDAGGVWSPAMASGTGVFDPAVDAATTYTYTINIAGCTIVSADVVVTVNPAVDAGLDGALSICATGGTTDLFGQLGGTPQAGGVWSPAMASGTGVFDPTVDAGVTYTYTVTGTAPCADATADVIVTITAGPDAGLDGTLVACTISTATDLFGQLGGTPDVGGVWSPAMASGTGVFDPSVDAAGIYTYTVNISGCVTSTADVVVTVNLPANAGTDGLLVVCPQTASAIQLSDILTGEDAGGVWLQTGGIGGTFNPMAGVFTPSIGTTTATFTYTVAGTAPCPDDVSNVTIEVNEQPDTGLDGNTAVCESSTTVIDLFALLTAPDTGGVWSQVTGTGGVFNATAGTFTPAAGATTSTFEYTILGVDACVTVFSTVTVVVDSDPLLTSLTNNSDICAMSDAIFTLVGTADAVVTYSVDGGASQTVTLDATGNGIVTVPTVQNTSTAVNVVLTLSDITNPTTLCSTSLTNTSTVIVNPNPDVTSLTNNSDICAMSDAIFTLVGTADAVVTYSVDGGASQTVTLDATGNGIVTVPTVQNTSTAVNVVLTLSDITNPTTLCSTSLTNTSTVVVNPNPDVTSLTNNSDICAMSDAIFTLMGTADAVVTYSVDGGASQTVTLDATGNGIVTVPTVQNTSTAVNVVLTLSDITNPTTLCSTSLTNTSTVIVNPNPDVTSLTNNSDICAMSDAIFTLVGTADAVVTYSVDGGAAQTVTLDATGNGIVTVPTVQNTSTAVNVVLTLSDITNPTTLCSTSLTNTSTVIVNPNPDVTSLTNNSDICAMSDAIFTLVGTADAVVTYSVDGGASQTVTLDATGNGIVTVPTVQNTSTAVNVVLTLSDITNPTTLCSTSLTNTSTVIVNPNPDVTSLTNNSDICAMSDAIFTLVGTADAVVTYSVDGGASQTVTLDATGNGIVTVPTVQNTSTAVNVVLTLSDITNPTTLCSTSLTSTSTVVVNPNPLPNAVADMEECDVDVNGEPDLDGLVVFDLASNTNAIGNGLGNVSVSYYTALDGTGYPINQVADATAYTNDLALEIPLVGQPNVMAQPIYVLVVNNDTGCYGVSSFNLIVNTVTFTPAVDLFACDDDNDTFGYFDLAAAELQMTGGATNLDVTFHETLAEAEQGVGIIPTNVLYQNVETDIPGVQTLYLNVTDTDTGCSYTAETIVLNVLASPVLPEGALIYPLCEDVGSTDGFVVFDLLDYAYNQLAIDPALNVAFYTGLDASGNPTGFIGNPGAYTNTSLDQVIYIAISNSSLDSNGDACTTLAEITLHVDSLPAADHYLDYVLCDDDYYLAMDGTQTFDLPSQLPNMIASTDGLVITYYQDWDALTGIYSNPIDASDLESYDNTSNPQDIFVEFVNEAGCPVVKILKLTVNPNPTPLSNQQIVDTLGNEGVMEECDGDVDGSGAISEQVATFDLTQWETVILTGTGPAMEEGVSATYYTSIDNAESGVGAIGTPTAFTNTSNPQTIYMSVVNDGTGINPVTTGTGCATIVEFQLFVPVPEVSVIADKEVICIDVNGVPLTDTSLPLLTATAGPQDFNLYDYQWSLNGVVIAGATNNTLEATVPGDYTVTVSGPTDFDCINVSQPITIGVSGIPSDFNASVTTNAFADSHQVVSVATSNIPGVEFWYSLDGGVATMDGTFDNVSPGLHYVTITDGEGCWSHIEQVTLIDYPHFFTPNGDGINDTWAIIGQEGIPISQIYIFDRFGKLLKQLDPDGAGWDGTYNGNQMPATDYWFKIIYIEGTDSTQKEFKAHFSIKR